MADGLSPAKVVLLAAQLASAADITSLRYLFASRPKILRRNHLILRILLTFLPETLESAVYIPLLDDYTSATVPEPPKPTKLPPLETDISEEDASKNVRRLHLLPLLRPSAPKESDLDPLTQFLIHRAYRVDAVAGLLPQILSLLVPFLDRSEYLRTWTIVTLLPLLRFSYEYYPEDACTRSLEFVEGLDNAKGVQFWLSKVEAVGNNGYEFVGRDIKGLIGPWMYGDSQRRRGKDGVAADMAGQTVAPLDESTLKNAVNSRWPGWDQVFLWIMSRADSSWALAADAIEQWDGPGDVDLGAYGGGVWLEEDDQQLLEVRYARTALATAYLIREASIEALTGVYRILTRIVSLLDHERLPTLPASASLLLPIPFIMESDIMRPENARHLQSFHLEDRNILTRPTKQSISLLQALTISAYLLTRAGYPCSVKKAGELALLQNEKEQMIVLQQFVNATNKVSKSDDKYWIRIRHELLWLRDWAAEPSTPADTESLPTEHGIGIFGRVRKEHIEVEILKALLSNDQLPLARSIYESSTEKPLAPDQVATVVIAKSRLAYDNATNGNKTRGGVKKSLEIMQAFPETLENSDAKARQLMLVEVADQLSKYRLVLKHGQPFRPADISAHRDPLALVGIVLDQNPGTYTQLNQLRRIGDLMFSAGLTLRDTQGLKITTPEQERDEKILAEKRIISMCVDAALAVDDFETAYSYVMNNLRTNRGYGVLAPSDDWSWRASLQAGKYRRNENTTKPTHLGNASANPEIRHLEQRMECLSQALRIAPKTTLAEILNVFRRCEEELATQTRLEEEAAAAWDAQADQQAGISGPNPAESARDTEEDIPMSLFDLGRRSAENAKKSLASLRASQARTERLTRESNLPATAAGGHDNSSTVKADTVRKRDQLKNAAVGTLAAGVGWLINAPPVNEIHRQDEA